VGATQSGWKWDWKYWEDAYNSAIQGVDHDDSSSSDSDSDAPGTSNATATTSSRGRNRTAGSADGSDSDDERGGSASSSDDSSEEDEPALDRLRACAVAVNRDGTLASGSAQELALAKSLASAKGGRGPAGRFGGRDGKMARIRAQEEQQAAEARSKLGLMPAASGGGAQSEGAQRPSAGAAARSKKRKGDQSSKAAADGADTDAAGAAATDADSSKQRSKKSKRAEKEALKPAAAGVGAAGAAAAQRQSSDSEQQQQKPKPKIIIVTLKGQEARAAEPFTPTPISGWWGAKMFASAGRLEGTEEEVEQKGQKAAADGEKPGKQRAAFDEDMQAALYNKLQAAQRQGKRGMGKAAVKIAGGNWEGKKTTFQEEEEGEEAGGSGSGQAEEEAGDGAEAAAAAGRRKRQGSKQKSGGKSGKDGKEGGSSSTKKRKQEHAEQQAAEQQQAEQQQSSKKVKWVKLAVAELERAPKQRMKWSLLWTALWQQEAVSGQGAGAKEAKREAWDKISGSSKVEVEGKKVKLLAAS